MSDMSDIARVIAIFYNMSVISDEEYKFSGSGIYYTPPEGPCETYLQYIRSLPQIPHPEVSSLAIQSTSVPDTAIYD